MAYSPNQRLRHFLYTALIIGIPRSKRRHGCADFPYALAINPGTLHRIPPPDISRCHPAASRRPFITPFIREISRGKPRIAIGNSGPPATGPRNPTLSGMSFFLPCYTSIVSPACDAARSECPNQRPAAARPLPQWRALPRRFRSAVAPCSAESPAAPLPGESQAESPAEYTYS